MTSGVSTVALQRLKKDYQRLLKEPVPFMKAAPLETNILEWRYIIIGAPKTPYEGGIYMGKLLFPKDFPFKPPAILMLTPNGRFQPNAAGMRFYRTYLLVAGAFCSLCTLAVIFNCGWDDSPPATPSAINGGGSNAPLISSPTNLPETFLYISILTSPNETERRQNVRDTWFRLSTKGPSVFIAKFAVGTMGLAAEDRRLLAEENEKFGDLALLDRHEESYERLAKKTLACFVHAFANFKFKFFLKTDIDSFVRITPLIINLKQIQDPMLYWGFLDGRAKPFRKGKWKEPEWNLCDRYLPYQLGGGYVLSYELIRFLAINAQLFRHYRNEDVSVGAWIGGLDVKYVHDPRFDTEWRSRGCNNEYLITHKHTEQEMQEMFENLKKTGKLCAKEFQKHPSYVYDFSKAPSECCTRVNGSNIP